MKNDKDVFLTQEQRDYADENYDKMPFKVLIRKMFNNESLDPRYAEGRAVKMYLSSQGKKPVKNFSEKSIDLSDEQKEFINNNIAHQTAYSIAQVVWKNPSLSPKSFQFKAVVEYIKSNPELDYILKNKDGNYEEIEGEYKSPNTLRQMCEIVNSYLRTNFVHTELNSYQKKNFEFLINAMNSPRYLQMINSYTSGESRRIFEGEFVRTAFDKPDLTYDDINLCVNLCWNYVQHITINKHLDMLNIRYSEIVGDPESKLSVSLAEMIKSKTKELHDCDTRQQRIIADLQGTRDKRNGSRGLSKLTVASLLEFWKEETERRKLIERQEIRRQEVAEEVDRLESMDEFKARIMGFTKSELING